MPQTINDQRDAAICLTILAERNPDHAVINVVRDKFGCDRVAVFRGQLRTVFGIIVGINLDPPTFRIMSSGVNPDPGRFGLPNSTILSLSFGWTGIINSRAPIPINVVSWEDSGIAVRGVENLAIPDGTNFRLYGHSAGAILVEALAYRLSTALPRCFIHSITTYGGPKPGWRGAAYERGAERTRYMAEGDATPLFPATVRPSGGILWASAVSGERGGESLLRCVHGSGGIIINETSRRPGSDASCPRGNQTTFDALVQGATWAEGAHTIANYANLLSVNVGRAQLGPPAPAQDEPSVNFDDVADIRRALQRRQLEREPEEFFVLQFPPPGAARPRGGASGSSGRPQGVIRMTSKVRGKIRFIAKPSLIKPHWHVYWDNILVATFDRASMARTFAKYGNRFIRWMSNNSLVTVGGMINAMTAFLQDAATGDNGNFIPPLQTSP